MTSRTIREKVDVWVIGLFVICGFSMAAVFNLVAAGQASAFTLQQTAPTRYSSPMASADGCYSNLNAVGKLSGLLGTGQWGLVNAIMNLPVYDWDQGIGPITYHLANAVNTKGALRGNVLETGQSVGYVKNFDFTETPVPNPYWVMQWLMNPEPPIMPKNNGDYVANPFIYQQFAAIDSSGLPIPALLNGNQTPHGGDKGQYNDANNGIDQMGNIVNGQDNGKTDNAQNNSDYLHENYTPDKLTDPDLIGQLVSGVFGFASHRFGVRGDSSNDNCFESMKQSGYSAPSYAFSVVNAAIPITIPGWMYSPITFLDTLFTGHPSVSSSGITFYMGGTVNHKFILDCYGRGRQPIVVPSGKDLLWFLLGGEITQLSQGMIGSVAVNGAIVAGVIAANTYYVFGIPIPNVIAIQSQLRGLPAIKTAWENYFYGFAFAFKVDPTKNFALPDHLNNRVVNLNNSKFFDVNPAVLAANPAICGNDYHKCSQNGAQFNPDVYITLKQPYVLSSDIDFSSNDYHRTPDGQSMTVTVDALKNGFNQNPYAPYDRTDADDAHSGGPTYNDNAGPNGRSFTKARIYRLDMKPGVVPNAIDVDKLDTSKAGWEDALTYQGDPATANVCDFFRDRLEQGDGRALASRVPDEDTPPNEHTNANKYRPAFQKEDAYKCKEVKSIDLRMDDHTKSGNQHTKEIFSDNILIPAETPPGTKICFAVYYDNYTNDIKYQGVPWWKESNKGNIGNYNKDYATPDNTSYLSRAKCIVAGYKPSFQVRGGDLMVGQNVYTNTNIKDDLTHKQADGSYHKRIYGSWAEYGAVAGGVIKHLGTGSAYRLGMPASLTEEGPLTFANDRDSSNVASHDYGKYTDPIDDGFMKVAERFSQEGDTAQILSDSTINLYDLQSGTYKIQDDAVVTLVSKDSDGKTKALKTDRSIVLLAGRNSVINVKSDIRIPVKYDTAGEISQVVITPQNPGQPYVINVAHNVTQVDAWLINPDGALNTCWIQGASGTDYRLTPRSLGECDNILYVNGPVSAQTIYLRRNGGKDQSDDPTKLEQSIPGEVFNLRPDAYIWAANHVDSSNKKYITTNVLDLPPRY